MRRRSDSGAAHQARKQRGRQMDPFLHVQFDLVELMVDRALLGRRQGCRAHQVLHKVAIAFIGGHAPGAGVKMIESRRGVAKTRPIRYTITVRTCRAGYGVERADMGFEVFGVGVPEMVLILVVALIFLGPEKLPDAARSIGAWVREIRS